MKVQLLARPDHALFLYNYLKREIEIQMLNFNVAKKGSWLHKLYPAVKLVDNEVEILNDFTFIHQIIFRLSKTGLINPYKWESVYSEFAFRRRAQKYVPNLIHYWPLYCHNFVRKQRLVTNAISAADVYCAHPYHILNTIRPEYDKYNIDIRKSYFSLDSERMIAFLEHELNIITNSDYVKDSFLQFSPQKNIYVADYGFLGDKTTLAIYNQALLDKKEQSLLRLVYVGSVSIEKGVTYLLEAITKLNSPSIQLDVIGPIKHDQEKIFKPYYSKPYINFLGPKPNAVIKKELKNYSALVLPSLSDANSIAVIEGLQNALPVIITESTGNKGAVKKYNIGKVIPAANSDALTEAIENIRNPDVRRNLSENIKNFITDDLKYPYPLKVLDIYRSLLATKNHL